MVVLDFPHRWQRTRLYGILLAAALGLLLVAACSSPTPTPTPTPSPTPPPPPSAPTPSIAVQDQEVTSNSVVIAQAAIDKPGWIEIHAEAAQGGLDPATDLGHVHIDAGRHTNVTVPLSQPVSSGQTLYAMLHYDQPADGTFTFAPGNSDDPPVVVSEQVVVQPFTVTTSQASEPREVRVVLRGLRFQPDTLQVRAGETIRLVIENQDASVFHTFTVEGLESVIDFPVGGGQTVQHEVTIPESASGNLVLFCKPHRGAGMVGTFSVQ